MRDQYIRTGAYSFSFPTILSLQNTCTMIVIICFVHFSIPHRFLPTVPKPPIFSCVGWCCCLLLSQQRRVNTALPALFSHPGQGFLIVYSVASRSSFDAVNNFRDQILRVKDEDEYPMIILGNKCDLENEREVQTNDGKDLSKSLGCPFLETSAKARINVEEAFYEVVREIRKWNAGSGLTGGSGSTGASGSSDSKESKPTKRRGCMIL
jgi:hypothetical protein